MSKMTALKIIALVCWACIALPHRGEISVFLEDTGGIAVVAVASAFIIYLAERLDNLVENTWMAITHAARWVNKIMAVGSRMTVLKTAEPAIADREEIMATQDALTKALVAQKRALKKAEGKLLAMEAAMEAMQNPQPDMAEDELEDTQLHLQLVNSIR